LDADNVLSEAEMKENFPGLRARVYNEQPMEEEEREDFAQGMSEGAEGEEEGGTCFHPGALEFTQEDEETMAIADLGSRKLSGTEGGLRGLRLGEGQELPRRPHTAKTHQEVRSRLSAGRESLGRTGASGKETSLLAQVRESSAQEQLDREADVFETTKV
jgi:hypothetical protein